MSIDRSDHDYWGDRAATVAGAGDTIKDGVFVIGGQPEGYEWRHWDEDPDYDPNSIISDTGLTKLVKIPDTESIIEEELVEDTDNYTEPTEKKRMAGDILPELLEIASDVDDLESVSDVDDLESVSDFDDLESVSDVDDVDINSNELPSDRRNRQRPVLDREGNVVSGDGSAGNDIKRNVVPGTGSAGNNLVSGDRSAGRDIKDSVLGDGSAGGSIATASGKDSQAAGDGSLLFNLDSALDIGDTVDASGDIDAGGSVNVGTGNQFVSAYDYNDDHSHHDNSVALDYALHDHDQQNLTLHGGFHGDFSDAIVNANTTNIMGGEGGLDNLAGAAAYGSLMDNNLTQGYGRHHSEKAKSAIDDSPINQVGLGESMGENSDYIDNNTLLSRWNSLGSAGLMNSNFWDDFKMNFGLLDTDEEEE